ncbi:FecR family protein [Pseudothauera rhizosphaerae]|nr:DUF4880 domain-containing protein [Pseudothauera rhizosphaerae]
MFGSREPATDQATDALDEEARAWLRRLRGGGATGRDAHEFKAWCARSPAHRQALTRAERQWCEMEGAQARYDAAFPGRRASAGADLLRGRAVNMQRRWLLRGAVSAGAAAAVLAALRPPLHLWPSLQDMAADRRTGTGEQARLALGRDVEVLLNTRTSIDVKQGPAAAGIDRIRLLDGEVAVQRRPGARPVEILAGAGRIVPEHGGVEARRAGPRYCVTCTAGQAWLEHPQGRVELRERERVWYDGGRIEPAAAVDLEVASAWQRGNIVFRATPLSDAVEEINRYRPGRVMLTSEALAARQISGQFQIHNLDEAIRQIQQIYDADVTWLPAGVVIVG